MKWYRLQRKRGELWYDYPSNERVIRCQSIKYMQGYQDAVTDEHPKFLTRIIWEVSPSRVESVRQR